jgi:hypothetical protein
MGDNAGRLNVVRSAPATDVTSTDSGLDTDGVAGEAQVNSGVSRWRRVGGGRR